MRSERAPQTCSPCAVGVFLLPCPASALLASVPSEAWGPRRERLLRLFPDDLPRPPLPLLLEFPPHSVRVRKLASSQEAFQVFLSVFTVQFLRCQWVALLSLRFLSWACSEHVLPASPLPPPSRQSGPCASFPEQCGACRVPRVLSPACPSSPRRLHHHVLLRIPVGVSPAQTCVSTGAQTACPSECVLSFPGACSLCGLPFMVALGSRFLSVHVLPALSAQQALVVPDAASSCPRNLGADTGLQRSVAQSSLAVFLWVSVKGQYWGFGWLVAGRGSVQAQE